ncbi:MAG TPA: YeeE/YedE family protein [Chthoniobacterales bacterium]|nr:YeeE/YedE family protein [Chthoniobacterales bacterium]
MDQYTLLNPLVGGILIGFASLLATVLSGRIPGISGVFGRLLVPTTPDPPSVAAATYGEAGKTWRVVFLLGLIGGAALSFALWQSAALYRPMRPLVVMAIAGLLVGFGTRLGGGCTSGHGVCGVGMGAKDSIAATLIFMAAGMLTVIIYHRVIL